MENVILRTVLLELQKFDYLSVADNAGRGLEKGMEGKGASEEKPFVLYLDNLSLIKLV